nr:hypothetical protein [Tanacetum cinerariifolium]
MTFIQSLNPEIAYPGRFPNEVGAGVSGESSGSGMRVVECSRGRGKVGTNKVSPYGFNSFETWQCVSAKRTAWNEFSCSMASTVICLATELVRDILELRLLCLLQCWYNHNLLLQRKKMKLKCLMLIPLSPTTAPSPPPQDLIPTPLQAQPATPSSPTPEQPTETFESSIPLLNTLLETSKEEGQEVREEGEVKVFWFEDVKKGGEIAKINADDDITLVDMETQVYMDAELQGMINDVNAAEPTVFDDEEVTMTMAQTLIKMKAEKAKLFDEQIAKRLHDEEVEQVAARKKMIWKELKCYNNSMMTNTQARKNMVIYLKNMVGYKMEHFRGMTYDKVSPIFEKEYNKVQTLFKLDKDVEEPRKKRVAEEPLLQESFKKLKAVEVSVTEFKGEALQVKYPLIDREIHSEGSRSYWKIVRVGGITEAYQSFEDMLKGFDREDLVALWSLVKEKFSTTVPTVNKEKALWVELTRLFEPNADDVLWKLQRYMHDLLT